MKKAFLKHSAGKLCVFFGPQRGTYIFSWSCSLYCTIFPLAKEVILSHMITFLNDKVSSYLVYIEYHSKSVLCMYSIFSFTVGLGTA